MTELSNQALISDTYAKQSRLWNAAEVQTSACAEARTLM